MQVRLGRRIRTDACIFDGPAHLHLIDWRLIRCLSANVLSSFCKQECAELVVFGTGCRSTARIIRKPPIQAVFFRLHPRVCAGYCGFMFTSLFQQLALGSVLNQFSHTMAQAK